MEHPMTYIVYNYPEDGGRAADFDENFQKFQSLTDARHEAAKRLGLTVDEIRFRKWDGFEANDAEVISVEAYHEHASRTGCGGVQISASPATLRSDRM